MSVLDANSDGSSREYSDSSVCTRLDGASGNNLYSATTNRAFIHASSSSADLPATIPHIPSLDSRYKVTNPQGICLVINISKYQVGTKHQERIGSDKDVYRIKELFTNLKFDVIIHQNLTGSEIHSRICEVRNQIKDAHGCFVCFLMAHGNKGCIFGIDGGVEKINDLIAVFQGNRCKELRRKPKIFFIQACRGDAAEIDRHPPHSDGPLSLRNEMEYCPTDSDFLICYPTLKGYVALRDPNNGTVFVQSLCDVIQQKYKSDHLEDMMTEVNRLVIQSPTREGSMDFYSVPERQSRLTKQCYLDPELAQADEV